MTALSQEASEIGLAADLHLDIRMSLTPAVKTNDNHVLQISVALWAGQNDSITEINIGLKAE